MNFGKPVVFGAFAFLAVAACNNGGSSQPADGGAASAAASVASAAPSAQMTPPRHRNHRGGGIFGMLLRASRELTLTDAQKDTIGTLDDQLHADDATRGAELKALDTDVVAGIRAGTIDTAKVQADYTAIDAAMQAQLAKESTAVNGLHAALDAGQRKQLVDGIHARQAEREQRMKNAPDAGQPDFVKMRLQRLTNELALDDAQQKQVTAVLMKNSSSASLQAQKDVAKQRFEALLTAFTADSFDAAKIAPPGKSLHEGMERDVALTTQLLPILKPEQREKMAVQRERMAQMRSRMGTTESPWGDESIMEEGLHKGAGPGSGFGAP